MKHLDKPQNIVIGENKKMMENNEMSMELKIDRIMEQNKEQTKKLDAMYEVLLDANNGVVVRVTKLESSHSTILTTIKVLFIGAYTGIITAIAKSFS